MGHGTMLDFISTRDHRLMRRINNWRAPQWIRVWMTFATRGGDGWLWYAMSLAILVFGGPDRYAALLSAGMAAGAGTLLFLGLKRKAKRQRPCVYAEHCWAKLLPPDQFSFPSGHSINAFSFAIAFSLFYPSWTIGLLFCAFSIATSRVILGMHFLSDILVGAAMGTTLAYASVILVERFVG
jgi:undecaprenyl-diphosphatase